MMRVMALFLLCIVILCGCWDRQEPENLSVVLAMGFHWLEERNQYEVIVQVANPLGMTAGRQEGGMAEQPATWTKKGQGLTPLMAVRAITLRSTRDMFFGHTIMVLFSWELAQKGIGPVLDFLEREKQNRLVSLPVVTQHSLEEVMEAHFFGEELGGEAMRHAFRITHREYPVIPIYDLVQVINILSQPGREIIMGLLKLEEEEEEDEEELFRIHLHQSVAFKGDRAVGILEGREMVGWQYVENILRQVPVIIEDPRTGGPLDVEIYRSWSQMEPLIHEDGVEILLNIEVLGRFQATDRIRIQENRDSIEALNRSLAQVIRGEVEGSLQRAQAWGSDIFGFGHLLYRKEYSSWLELEDTWQESFANLQLTMDVQASIHQIGLSKEPPTIWGKEP